MRIRIVLLLLTVFAFHVPAAAQDPEEDPGWSGSAELSFVSASGNADSTAFGAGGELRYERDAYRSRFNARFLEVESEGQTTAESYEAVGEAIRALRDDVSVFARGGWLRNRFAGVADRYSVASGLEWQLVDAAMRKFEVNAGVGYTTEERILSGRRSFATAVAGAHYLREFSERSKFENRTDANANLENASDWRMRNVAALVAGLNDLLALKLAVDVNYMNAPDPGFEKTDTVTSVAVVVSF